MYPNITLYISPEKRVELRLHSDKDNFKSLGDLVSDLDQVVVEFGQAIGLDEQADALWELASVGDEMGFDFPGADSEAEDFTYRDLIEKLQELHEEREDFGDYEIELRDELVANWCSDALAAAVSSLYDMLITRTVVFADDVAAERIVLDDKSNNARFAERMGAVLNDMELELFMPEANEQETA